jgi:uncharacterized repeat protein (TIGR03943 family)
VSREIQALVMVLLGGAVLRISIDGTYLRYVKPGFQIFLLVAGAIVLVLGLLSAWFDGLLRRSPVAAGGGSHDAGHEHAVHDDGHGHGASGPRAAWLLLLPVLAIFLVAPPALGAYSANRTTFVGQPSSGFEALPASDPVDLAVRDYVARAVWDGGATLQDRRVALTGFAVEREDGGWDLARLALSCCAADALASRVRPVGDDVPVVEADQWVRVVGTWTEGGGLEDPRAVPNLNVESVELIEEPREPYE